MAKNFKAIAERVLGTTESISGNLLETRATRDKGMNVNCMYLSIRIYRWQGIAKAVGTRVSGNIGEYCQNLLLKQSIICNEGALRQEVVTRT